MSTTPFRDFIPEGEETGGQGKGFTDFVPSRGETTVPIPTTDADVESWSSSKPVKSVEETIKPITKSGRRVIKKV